MRTEAKTTGDEAKSLTAKLFGNSSYGKMGECIEKYRDTKIEIDDDIILTRKTSALYKSSNDILTDGTVIGNEISSLKRSITDDKPVHIAVAILQNAKLLFLRLALVSVLNYRIF